MAKETAQIAGNQLLAALPQDANERLRPQLDPITFSLGQVVYESGAQMRHVYFPTTSHISLLYTMIDGSTAEIGLVGNEGVVGIALFMGGETTPNRAVVQGGGLAFRMKATLMLDEFNRGGEFQHLMLRYTQALITQISQNGCLQSSTLSGTAPLSLAANDSRPDKLGSVANDP